MKRRRSRLAHAHGAPCWFAAGVIRHFQSMYGIKPRSGHAGHAECGGPVVLLELAPANGTPRLLECHMCPNAADPFAISVHDVTNDRQSVGNLADTYVHEDVHYARVKLANEIKANGYIFRASTRGEISE